MTHGPEWYDEAMVEEGSPAMLPLEESPWLPLYEEVAKLIQPHEAVVDLGCGTGRFLELLCRQEHYAQLEGVDWSRAALAEATDYAWPTHEDANPIVWTHCDLADWSPYADRAGNTVYVCTEVIEHLELDIELVRSIPIGHRFIFSVPSYESESHLRWFTHVGHLWGRYAPELTFSRWVLLDIDDTKSIHLVEARRRKDAW